MNFRYSLFETNSNPKNNRHFKPLVFLCANNHLYPIENDEHRQTIFKKYASSIGGGIKKINVIKDKEEEEELEINILDARVEEDDDGNSLFRYHNNDELINDFADIRGRGVFKGKGDVQNYSTMKLIKATFIMTV